MKRGHYLHVIVTSLMTVSMFACGGAPKKPSADELRSRLRRNADGAMSEVTRRRRPDKRPARASESSPRDGSSQTSASARDDRDVAAQLPEGVACSDQLSCFSTRIYLVAEGLGASERDAEIDATTRLASKINSEVSSTVSLNTVEGDGIKSRTTGEVKQTIKSNFKRNELIGYVSAGALEDADDASRFKVFAYLKRARYQEELDRELERPLRALSRAVSALNNEASAEVFVRAWGEFVRQRSAAEAPLAEYRVVVGSLPQAYREIKPQLVKAEQEADARRRKAHFIIEISGAEAVQQKIKTFMKQSVRALGPRVSAPGTCLRGDYLLQVEAGIEEGVHQLTGGSLKKLRWGVTLFQCGADAGQRREIAQIALPHINAVERYNASAEMILGRQIKALSAKNSLRKKKSAQSKREQKLKEAVNAELRGLVELVVPQP